MPELVDFIVILDDRMTVRRVEWVAHPLSPAAEQLTEGWMGLSLLKIPDAAWDLPGGSLLWQGQRFDIARCTLDGSTRRAVRLVDLKNIKQAFALPAHAAGDVQHFSEHTVEIDRPQIFVVNLNAVRDRVERALKQLFPHVFPSRQNATITALREKRAVSGRFDKYKSMTGKELQTVNAAYLIMQGERVLGAACEPRAKTTCKNDSRSRGVRRRKKILKSNAK